MNWIRRHLSYANVMATLALFVALAGSATAAGLITGRNIKDDSIRGRDIAPNTLSEEHFVGHDHRVPLEQAQKLAGTRSSRAAVSAQAAYLTTEKVNGNVSTSNGTSGGSGNSVAQCPAGTIAISAEMNYSGGFNGAPVVRVDYMQRLARATANFGNGLQSYVQAIAVCVRGS